MSFKLSLSGWEDHLEATYGPDLDSELFSATPAIAWHLMGDRPVADTISTIVTTEPLLPDPGEVAAA
jgi:hypothetical protein